MKRNFESAFLELMELEGGFANLEGDTGGKTKYGITEKTWLKYCAEFNIIPPPRIEDITRDDARKVYKEYYWRAVKCDFLPSGVDFAVFDFCVHSGEYNASRVVQQLVDADVDGIFGMQTLHAVCDWLADGKPNKAYRKERLEEFIEKFAKARRVFLRKTTIYKTYPQGMENRVDRAEEAANRILNKSHTKRSGKMLDSLKGSKTIFAAIAGSATASHPEMLAKIAENPQMVTYFILAMLIPKLLDKITGKE